MAYGKIKADAIIRDNGGNDEEISMATIVTLDSGKAPLASPSFTGTVTLPGTVQVGGQATDVTIADNNANALEIKQGSNKYVTFDTTNSAERVEVDQLVVATEHITLNAQKELRLADSDSSHHIAIKAPATLSSNVNLTMPTTDGSADQVLKTNGSGVLDWTSISSDSITDGSKTLDFNSNNVRADTHIVSSANNTHDLGTSALRWRDVYTNDLNLSNEGSQNDVDGTWGSWTIQEGEEDLYLLNRRNGKKYKFNLTEV